jgi:vanillate monooxygenase
VVSLGDFQTEGRGLTFRIRDAQASVFAEDMDILDALQQNLLRHAERRLLDLKIDSGGVYGRRIIERELARNATGAGKR